MRYAAIGIVTGIAFGSILLTAPWVWAEDVGAIVAALNDPEAECRYLAQKVKIQNEAISTARKFVALNIKAIKDVLKLPQGSPEQLDKMKVVELIERQSDAAGNLSLQAQADVRTLEEVIRARRGSLDQCKAELAKVPPPKEVKVPE